MIHSATGMKPGERYRIENRTSTHRFTGFFLDGKYYLSPELLTAVGWLEDQQFIYDELDETGEPVFPDRKAGVIDALKLTLIDGAELKLEALPVDADVGEVAAAPPEPSSLVPGGRLNKAHPVTLVLGVLLVFGAACLVVGLGRPRIQRR